MRRWPSRPIESLGGVGEDRGITWGEGGGPFSPARRENPECFELRSPRTDRAQGRLNNILTRSLRGMDLKATGGLKG